MVFNSIAFAVFLPIVLGVYYLLTRRAQNVWLLAASCVFYGWWDSRFLLLLALSTVIDFYCANKIAASDVERTRKRYLLISLVSNLATLGFFKYFNFFIGSTRTALDAIGWNMPVPVLEIALPIGISFYTFQAMSYTIDVYRRAIPVCRDFVAFALAVSYFPHLVAGPIQRASFLLPQLEADRTVRWQQIREGVGLIVYGLFKKVGVADSLAPLVDVRFSNPSMYASPDLLFGLYLFAVQIYCDFSGYSDIARGTSKLFGIELMLNFDHPYFSRSITEFWRRWHISLSTWLREYLYVPLGGNRHGIRKTYRNLMLTMLLGGLWHGANWTFVIWGALHGLYLAVHKMILDRAAAKTATGIPRAQQAAVVAATAATLGPTLTADGSAIIRSADDGNQGRADSRFRGVLVSAVQILVTFHLVCLAWVFFRADSLPLAFGYLAGIVRFSAVGQMESLNWLGLRTTILFASLAGVEIAQWRSGRQTVFSEWHWSGRGILYAGLILVILVFGGLDADVPFIYFQF